MLSKRIYVSVLALLLLAGPLGSLRAAAAQSNTGRLVGTVSGPDGVIAGAKVEVTDSATAKVFTAVSTEEGTFAVPLLNFGTYTVKVTAPGFKTYAAKDVRIDVGKDYSLVVALQVGNVDETVTVVAGEDLVHATSAELSNTVSTRQIQDLPLQGRNPLTLIGLQSGTSSNGFTDTTINGQRSSFTNITRDGINIQDNFIRANATDFVPDRPSTDNVGEFTIVTQNAGAESGNGASQVRFVTPRGSNQWHGAGEITNRNSYLAANDFFNNASHAAKPFLNRNQFGGKFSGPIKKDKLFFFVNSEFLILRTSSQVQDTILLGPARSGVFTYTDNSGARRTLNVLNAAGVAPSSIISNRILANTPTAANNTNSGDGLNTGGFLINRLANQTRQTITARADYNVNDNQSISAVFSYNHEFLDRPDVDNGGFAALPFGNQDANTPFLSVSHHWNIGASLVNELRGGFQFSDPKFDRTGQQTDFFLTLPLITSPESTFQLQGRNTQIITLQDNATKSKGQHTLTFGGSFYAYRFFVYGPPAFANSTIPTLVLGTNTNSPSLSANLFPGGISSSQLTTANSLLALLGGIVSSENQTFNATSQTSGYVANAIPHHNLAYEDISGYFSDQWRATPRLTLNIGLRYELYTPIREPNGLALEPVFNGGPGTAISSILDPTGTYNFVGTNLGGHKFFNVQPRNFSPILSFAYSPQFKNKILNALFPGKDGGNRTVIRGGFRISYANDEFVRSADNALSGDAGLAQAVSLANLNARVGSQPAIPTPVFQVPRTFAQNNALAGNFGTVFAIDPSLQIPRIYEYNFGIERELGAKTAIEIRYVGSYSNNLVRGFDLNQVDVTNNGFAADFIRARNNLLLTGNAACTTAGCQPLTVFPKLGGGGLLTNSTVKNDLIAGNAGDLAILYVTNLLAGSVRFLANPSTGAVDFLTNNAKYSYNSLQLEFRRRLANGLYFQANYTFSKDLTNASGVGQTRFDPLLNNATPNIDYARADFDQTQVFNFNGIYELPFGNGKRFMNGNGVVDRILGGFEIASIFRISSGAPLSIIDPSGTLNRVGRSGRQTANSSLSDSQIQNLIGVFNGPNGVYFINPSVIDPATRRGADGFGTSFAGEAFFNVGPGATGNLPRTIFNGPKYFDWDSSIIKRIRIREGTNLQLRLEAFNTLNKVNFFVTPYGTNSTVNSTSFGRITSDFSPRIVQLVARFDF